MQVSVESTSSIGRKLTIAVPAADIESALSERLKRFSKTARLPGFRPGKVPFKMIQSKYGNEMFAEVAGGMIESSLQQALRQEELLPAAAPEVTPSTFERGKDLEYVANFDLMPEIKNHDLVGIKVEQIECKITEADIDKTIETMRKQRIVWSPVDRKAKQDDRVMIDFKGLIDGDEFQGGTAQQQALVLGEGKFMKEFEGGLIGVKADEIRTINVNFPEDYRGEDVAGKTAVFEITTIEVAESKLPEIDEAFIKSFEIKGGDVDSLRVEVQRNMKRELDSRLKSQVRNEVMKGLLDVNPIEVPKKLIEEEIDRIIKSNMDQLKQQGVDVAEVDPDRSKFKGDAERRVALGLIFYDIVQKQEIKANPEMVKAHVESIAQSYEDPKEFITWYLSDPGRKQQVEAVVIEDILVEKLIETATVKTSNKSFDEMMFSAT